MKNRISLCILSAGFLVGGCSSGTNAAGAGPNVPSEALDAAKAQILDVSFKNCGEFWGSVYKKLNPLDFTPTGEFQFKNLKMTVEGDRMPLTEAQKMNGIQWMGLINFSADVSRERSIGAKDWSPWNDGFGAPYNTILISIVNGKVTMNGGTALRADCPQ
jgi:hypothetical protein